MLADVGNATRCGQGLIGGALRKSGKSLDGIHDVVAIQIRDRAGFGSSQLAVGAGEGAAARHRIPERPPDLGELLLGEIHLRSNRPVGVGTTLDDVGITVTDKRALWSRLRAQRRREFAVAFGGLLRQIRTLPCLGSPYTNAFELNCSFVSVATIASTVSPRNDTNPGIRAEYSNPRRRQKRLAARFGAGVIP